MADSIISSKKRCYITGSIHRLDKHHIMNGVAYRDKAEADGLWVYLNHDVHMWLHSRRPEKQKELKAIAQRCWIDKRKGEGLSESEALDRWMERYHKNYL